MNVLPGDAFASGFVCGHLQGWNRAEAARMGNATGASVVTRQGCANDMPTLDEASKFIEGQGGGSETPLKGQLAELTRPMSPAPTAPLSADLASNVLDYLGVETTAPDVVQLDALIAAYVRAVPWESASRIAKRARTPTLADCPRWPDEFWPDALHNGVGGTCFESNYAFFSLLRTLGYDGHLTINDMGATVGCHAAIILEIGRVRWLADVGLPLHVPLPIDPDQPTQRPSLLLDYTVRPVGSRRYQVERAPHPRPICYTLIDEPVDDAAYRAVTTADYGERGFFLEALVVNKIVDEHIWRFNSGEIPAHLETFRDGARVDYLIEGNVAAAVADRFGMSRAIVSAALDALKHGR